MIVVCSAAFPAYNIIFAIDFLAAMMAKTLLPGNYIHVQLLVASRASGVYLYCHALIGHKDVAIIANKSFTA